MAGGTGGCRPDNLWCHQWRRVGVVVALSFQWPSDSLICGCGQINSVTVGREMPNIGDAGSVVAGGTGGCRPDDLRCYQWRRGWRRGGSQFSVA